MTEEKRALSFPTFISRFALVIAAVAFVAWLAFVDSSLVVAGALGTLMAWSIGIGVVSALVAVVHDAASDTDLSPPRRSPWLRILFILGALVLGFIVFMNMFMVR